MADLIIKPATGDGNKLILQDKAGGAVLTTADSGATVANATLANATLDNATQDGITRLGTVTTGTMNNTIGSSATFPAGKVLNVAQQWLGSDTGVWGQHGTSNGQSWTTFWTASYTPQTNDCKVYAFLNIWLKVWANVVSPVHLTYRYSIAGTHVSDGTGTNIGDNDQIFLGVWGLNSASYWQHWALHQTIQLRGVTTSGGNAAINYTLQLANPNAASGNTGWVMYGDSTKEQTSITFMEVER